MKEYCSHPTMATVDAIIRFWSWADAPNAYRPTVDLPSPPDWVAVYSPAAVSGSMDLLLSLPGWAFAKQYFTTDGTAIVLGWKTPIAARNRFTEAADFPLSATELA